MNTYERVVAARAGNSQALDDLVAEFVPLVYNIVGRALNNPADTDDVVQNAFVEALHDLRKLRDPAAFRSWLVAITLRQIRRHWRIRRAAPIGPVDAELTADPGADFVDLTITSLQLSGQRREVVEATRWLEPDDRELLSLWWLEVAGRLTRAELSTALDLKEPLAAVRIQRMRAQLETARLVVRTLHATPRCRELSELTAAWDGRPSGLWRKRIARHIRECDFCTLVPDDAIPAERLLVGLPLLLAPPTLTTAVVPSAAAHSIAPSSTAPSTAGPSGASETIRVGKGMAHASKGMAHASKGLLGGKMAALGAAAAVVVVVTVGVVATRDPAKPPTPETAAQVAIAPGTAAITSPALAGTPSASPAAASTAAPVPASPSKKAVVVDMRFPVRAAFYYPWYDANPQKGGGSHWHPSAVDYDIDDPATVDRQIRDMQYGGLDAGIASWWGPGKREDKRLPLLLKEGAKLGFTWSLYYEEEGYADPSSAQILSELKYLGKYADSPALMHIKGKPVIFVWFDGNDACGVADRWAAASKTFYVVLKVFGGYEKCAHQPDSWHQYGIGVDVQKGYSAVAGPGFWMAGAAAPKMARDPATFRKNVTTVAQSGQPFQLITSYNEWGEGTAVESATEWSSPSGHGVYMDILHDVFG